jgi:hypothetical protein
MKTRLTLLAIALAAVLVGCGVDPTPTPNAPASTPTPTATTPAPTPTPSPTLTPTPTAVPPAWLTTLIGRFENEPVANPPIVISRYRYEGRAVYFVPQRCCDIFSDLYDEDGNVIAHPDGGITGQGDGRAPDFAADAQFQHVVWRDLRAPDGTQRVTVAVPIDLLEVVAIKTGYQANVVSGLPNGCTSFDSLTVSLDAALRLFTIEVINLAPAPDAQVACTLQYGMVDHSVLLEGVEAGVTYKVAANDATTTFTVQ